jgi:ParB family chromosome partitioning protein
MDKKIVNLRLSDVFPNPDQPRKHFDPDKLQELAMSIAEYGVQEPIKVVPRDGGYMIVMGERRYRASGLAGKETISAIVEDLTAEQVEELALLENIQREDLSVIEEANAFQSLLDRGMTKEELARKMGFKQLWRVDERTSLLKLSPEHQDLVVRGVITNSQAFEMSRVSHSKQALILKKIMAGELNSYNKLRQFVNGIIALEQQANIFELETASESEQEAIRTFDGMLRSMERFIREVYDQGKADYFKKAGFRADIKGDRLDLIIAELMKIRKNMLAGEGMKKAVAA